MNEDDIEYYRKFYGDVEIESAMNGIILKSPDGKRWRIQVSNAGVVTVTQI